MGTITAGLAAMDARHTIGFFGLLVSCTQPESKPDSKVAQAASAVATAKVDPGVKPAAPAPVGPRTQKSAAELNPAKLNETAPARFRARFDTSKGVFVVDVTREWSTHGADQFYNLVKYGYFNETRFFRAVKGFMVQFGVHGDPQVSALWRDARIKDDAPKRPNKRGYVSYGKSILQHSRTTQLFINLVDNPKLDPMGFPPIGKIDEAGMKVVDSLYTGYGESPPEGKGPDQLRLMAEGNAYLQALFPNLDYIKATTLE